MRTLNNSSSFLSNKNIGWIFALTSQTHSAPHLFSLRSNKRGWDRGFTRKNLKVMKSLVCRGRSYFLTPKLLYLLTYTVLFRIGSVYSCDCILNRVVSDRNFGFGFGRNGHFGEFRCFGRNGKKLGRNRTEIFSKIRSFLIANSWFWRYKSKYFLLN